MRGETELIAHRREEDEKMVIHSEVGKGEMTGKG